MMTPLEEAKWLLMHPDFEERPASVDEFLGERYLNVEAMIRPGVKEAMREIFEGADRGERIAAYERAIFTGAIGIGKTTLASLVIPYMVHWVLCLRDPQKYYGLLPGSRIAFMQMSTSEDHAREVIFSDIKARVDNSPWFQTRLYDPKWTKQLHFPRDIWVLPGDSAETTFEGYNILGGILDEADSHKITKERDYAQMGYQTIEARIQSRFVDNSSPNATGHKGFILVIGQMKSATGFAHAIYNEMMSDPRAKVVRMTIWESYGWDKYTWSNGERNSFYYDIKRKNILPKAAGALVADQENIIEIPESYKHDFKLNPEKALRDLAGIPPTATDPFISQGYKIEDAQARWTETFGVEPPVDQDCQNPKIAKWVAFPPEKNKRVAHLDIAYSADGDSAGIAMGYISELIETEEGDVVPYITFDLLIRVRAPIGGEVQIADLRKYFYDLKNVRNYNLYKVTMDTFQSVDTRQQLNKRKILTEELSVDKKKGPYEDLRDALYEDRISIPPYMTELMPGSAEVIDIVQRELLALQDTGTKIDHPKNGSKDVADCMAAVVHELMSDPMYRRGVVSPRLRKAKDNPDEHMNIEKVLSEFDRPSSQLPGPPSMRPSFGMPAMPPMGITIPDRLRNKR